MIVSISKHIYSVLSADQALAAIVGSKIFPLGTKDTVEFPFIVYQRDGIEVRYNKSAAETVEVNMTVYCVSRSYTESEALANLVASALDKKTGQYVGYSIVDAWVTGANEDYIDDSFVQQINFKFLIK